jgi:hypothetical protein
LDILFVVVELIVKISVTVDTELVVVAVVVVVVEEEEEEEGGWKRRPGLLLALLLVAADAAAAGISRGRSPASAAVMIVITSRHRRVVRVTGPDTDGDALSAVGVSASSCHRTSTSSPMRMLEHVL